MTPSPANRLTDSRENSKKIQKCHKKKTYVNPHIEPMLQVLSSCVHRSIAQRPRIESSQKKAPNIIWWGSRPNPETGTRKVKTKPRLRSQSKGKEELLVEAVDLPNTSGFDHGIHLSVADSNSALHELHSEIEGLKQSVREKPTFRSWHTRTEIDDTNWEAFRQTIFQNVVELEEVPCSRVQCGMQDCTRPASLCCVTCNNLYLCSGCDCSQHFMLPLHQRTAWLNGFFEPLSCCQTVTCTEDGILELDVKVCAFPLTSPTTCQHCGSEGVMRHEVMGSYILITTTGRQDVQKLLPVCDVCGRSSDAGELSNILRHGFWPGNPRRFTHLFQLDLLRLVDKVALNLPGSSMSGIAASLRDVSSLNGVAMPVSSKLLANALSEFRACQRELDLLKGVDALKCPPCSVKQHSCHMDGNFKVYRYAKVPRGTRTAYYKGVFIADNSEVSEHDRNLAKMQHKKPQEKDNLCGSSYWRAARDANKQGSASLDETGLLVAGCRHALASKAVNMFTGERFAYHHYLHINHVLRMKVKFMWQDVICKYWPWAVRLAVQSQVFKAAVTDVKPALSVMHAKAHAWDCQVVWSGGNQIGAGTTTGEDMEQFFSHLSRVGSTTKNMSASRREDVLTEHVIFWNGRKIHNMPQLLVKKYNRVKLSHQLCYKELRCLKEATTDADKNRLKWKEQIMSLATEKTVVGQTSTQQSSACQLFKLHLKVQEAAALGAYTSQASDATNVILGRKTMLQDARKEHRNLESLRTEYESLTLQLTASGENIDELLQEGRDEACRERLAELDSKLSLLTVAVKQRRQAISKLADSSKQRTKLRRRNEKDLRRLEEIAAERNKVGEVLMAEDVCVQALLLDGHPAFSRVAVAFDMQKTIVDLYEKVDRLQEEEQLLVTEMKNFVVFYKNILHRLHNDIMELHNCENFERCHHYCLKQFPLTRECSNGLLGLRKKGVSFAEQQLQSGISAFSKVLDGEAFSYYTSSEDELSDNENDTG